MVFLHGAVASKSETITLFSKLQVVLTGLFAKSFSAGLGSLMSYRHREAVSQRVYKHLAVSEEKIISPLILSFFISFHSNPT